ncbi:hypothetical protein Ancab_011473 [Ancistrocladus abbreviatus]
MSPSTKLPPFLCQTCQRDVSKLCFGGFSARSEEWSTYNSCRKGVEMDDASNSSVFSIVINPGNWKNNLIGLGLGRIRYLQTWPGKVEQHLAPHQIWDFIEHIGVRDKTNVEDVVRRIGDMEQRDWEMFQQIASVGK